MFSFKSRTLPRHYEYRFAPKHLRAETDASQLLLIRIIHSGIWVRESTAKMFNLGRIPRDHCDTLSSIPPPSHPDTTKLLIMLHDWFYAVDVYDENRKLLTVGEMENQFRAVVQDASVRLEKGEKAVPVGLLTADKRDLWAKVIARFRHHLSLMAISPAEPLTLALSVDQESRNSPDNTQLSNLSQSRSLFPCSASDCLLYFRY